MLLCIINTQATAQFMHNGNKTGSLILDHSPVDIQHIPGKTDSLWVILDESATPLWSNNIQDNYILVDPEESTTYTLYVLVDADTVEFLDFYVSVDDIIDFEFDTVCLGSTTTFNNTSIILSDTISSILWDLDGDTQFNDGEGETVVYTYQYSGTYLVGMRVYFTNGTFKVTYNAVDVGDFPVVNFSWEGVCFGNLTYFTSESTVSVGIIDSYHWDFGDGNTDHFKEAQNTFAETGNHEVWLKVTSSIGCADSISKTVEILETPDIELETSSGTVINNQDTVYFTQGQTITILIMNYDDFDSIYWFNDDQADQIILAEEGSYYVEAVTEDCFIRKEFYASWGGNPPEPSNNDIMNLFTPNGDGYNDLWIVNDPNLVFPINVNVYNRSGKQVYSSDNYGNNWDGQYNGNPLPQATYYYIIVDNNNTTYKGAVTIIR